MTILPDWQLPPGVDRGLWDYVQNTTLAAGYDASLANTPLLQQDLAFVDRQLPTPCRVIDLGCGTGRLLTHLSQRGFTCVGVDLSASMLAIAREKTRVAGWTTLLVRANLVELAGFVDHAFDAAACLFSTLGMLCGRGARRVFVHEVARLLRPGGVWVLHGHNRWFHLRQAKGWGWLAQDGLHWLGGRTEPGDRTMPTHQGGAPLTIHHFTKRELVQELQQAGFRIRTIEPVSLRPDGRLPAPWLFGGLRAYGYLVAVEKPA